jgi:tetratricopeptide (TPR) repeat protein
VAIWPAVKSFSSGCYNIFSRLLWLFVVIVVTTIVVQGLTQHATVIEPISVPKSLADSGYTPEVAGRRLRDAIFRFATTLNTAPKNPDAQSNAAEYNFGVSGFALQGDLPNIIVPTVGISLDAVVTTMRSLLHSTRSKNISGEFTIKDKLLWLHLRMDGNELYVSSSGVDPEKPDELLEKAVPNILEVVQPYDFALAQHKKDPANSLETVTEIIDRIPKTDPSLASLFNLKGNIYRERHNNAEAIKAFDKALSFNPDLADAHFYRGYVLREQNRNDEAIADYQKTISLNPKYVAAYNNLGVIYNARGKRKEALAEYNAAIEINPKYALGYFNIGTVRDGEGNHVAAAEAYRKSIELNPKYAPAHFKLAFLLGIQDKRDEEIVEYRKAIEINPKYAMAHYNLGIALTDPKEKEGEFRKAIEVDPKYASAHNNLGLVVTDPKEKEAEYREAIRLDPKHASAQNNLGLLLASHGKRDEAIAAYKAALAIDPNYANASQNLARLMNEPVKAD